MQQSWTKGIGEGALMAALTAIFALIGAYFPLASFITLLVVAVPITLVIVRNNFRVGFIASLVAAFLVAILAGPLTAVLFYIQFMFMALAYGYLFKNKAGVGRIIIIGTTVSIISTILVFSLGFMVSGTGFESQKEMVLSTVDDVLNLYEEKGMLEQIEAQGVTREDLKNAMLDALKVLPAMFILASMLSAIVNFIISRIILRRFGLEIPKFPHFSEWRLPWYAIWGLIAGWASFLIGDYYKFDFGAVLGQNILIAYGFILFVLGISVVTFFWKKVKLTVVGKVFFITIIFILWRAIPLITIFIGMFDLVLDYRKLNKKEVK